MSKLSTEQVDEVVRALTGGQGKTVKAVVERNTNPDVKHIVIPVGMKLKDAAQSILDQDKAEDKKVALHYEVDCFPLDGAVNLWDSLEEQYGFVKKMDGFWGEPPTMVNVPVGPGKFREVAWGLMKIPGIEGYLQTGISGHKFLITGETKQRHLPEIAEIVERLKERLRTNSIYKGQAVELDLSWMREGEPFHPLKHAPKFSIPLDGATEDKLIFSADVSRDIRTGLFAAIDFGDACTKVGVPVKRGVLLAGRYGTGKTMTAWVAAKKAVDAGMGFVYLKSVLDLEAGFHFARMYQDPKGVVVFSEDVDSAIPNHESPEMRNLQNAFDGVDTKNDKIITILTTNHLDKVPQALLRPGRIDVAVIVKEPDAQAAIRLIKQYGGNRLAKDTDFESIGKALAGHLPAEIRESVERAKMAAISRLCYEGHDPTTVSIEGSINHQDIMDVVRANETQHELLKPKAPDTRSDREKAADRYGKSMHEGLVQAARVIAGAVKDSYEPSYEGNGDRHLGFAEAEDFDPEA